MQALFSNRLLRWYRSRARHMPWRGERDPYKIWLSEVMLQQTQVETVIPYYERWIKKYPSVNTVARASEEEILKSWEGLGYYARAMNFYAACKEASTLYHGKVPSDPVQFSMLKGVGPYTLAAVQSIVYKKPMPAIDGNVKRVVSRLLRIRKNISKALPEVEKFLTTHIIKANPGDFNQAMMDLGATICKPRAPRCSICPVSKHCQAYKMGEVGRYPVQNKKKKPPHYKIAVGIIWKGNRVLVSKRKKDGLLGGLWEFPGGKIEKGESAAACVVREIKEEVGIRVEAFRSVGKIKHAYSHFSIEMEGILCKYLKGRAKSLGCDATRWIRFNEIPNFTFPKSNHKLFPMLPHTSPF